jgi:hypothetical protein
VVGERAHPEPLAHRQVGHAQLDREGHAPDHRRAEGRERIGGPEHRHGCGLERAQERGAPAALAVQQAREPQVEQVLGLVEQQERGRAAGEQALGEAKLREPLGPARLVPVLRRLADRVEWGADRGGQRLAELGLAGAGGAVEQHMRARPAGAQGACQHLDRVGRRRAEMGEVLQRQAGRERAAEQRLAGDLGGGGRDAERVRKLALQPFEHDQLAIAVHGEQPRGAQRPVRREPPLHRRLGEAREQRDHRRIGREPHGTPHRVGDHVPEPLHRPVQPVAHREPEDRRLGLVQPDRAGDGIQPPGDGADRAAGLGGARLDAALDQLPGGGVERAFGEQLVLARVGLAAGARGEAERVLVAGEPGGDGGGAARAARHLGQRVPGVVEGDGLFTGIHLVSPVPGLFATSATVGG